MRRLSAVSLVVLTVTAVSVTAGLPTFKVQRKHIEQLSSGMRQEFAGLHYLMNAYQIRQFLALEDDDERIRWMENFWKYADPTPTTPENEMRTEHNIRVKLAREFFGIEKWPGWDKRGEVFIRYGPPDYRGKVWGEVTVNKMRPPRELWYYYHHNMLVAFENFGLKGEYIYAIDPLGPTEEISVDLAEFLLYDTQESLAERMPLDMLEYYSTPSYTLPPKDFDPVRAMEYRASRPRELAEGIDMFLDPDVLEELPKDVSSVFHRDEVREVANNFEIVLEETPSSYPFNFEENDLRFYFSVEQFKGGRAKNRIDVAVEVPVIVEESSGSTFEETYRAEVVVWDSRYNEIDRKKREIVLRTAPEVDKWANLLPTQLVLSLPPGRYRLAVSVTGENSKRSSAYRTSFSCVPFGQNLGISDILFARTIKPSERSSIFARGALEVIPHPLRAYSRKHPIPVYFEIYDLFPDDRGITGFTVEYKVVRHDEAKKSFWDRFRGGESPAVSSKFEASGLSEDEVQHISINAENLDKGVYDLLITVTDDFTGMTSFRHGTFSLVD